MMILCNPHNDGQGLRSGRILKAVEFLLPGAMNKFLFIRMRFTPI